MRDVTIATHSSLGEHFKKIGEGKGASYLVVNNKRVSLVEKITIGRDSDNDVVVDNKLASRHHAVIQRIKNEYFLKDENSTNGTYVNSVKIPQGKYVKLTIGNQIKIGNMTLVLA